MESVSGVRCGIAQGGSCGVGNRARQDFARGMHRHVALSRESLHGALLPDTITGHRLGARQEFARGRSRWCGGAGAWHCDTGVNMEIIMKFGEALPCVKSPVSRTAGTIYMVT